MLALSLDEGAALSLDTKRSSLLRFSDSISLKDSESKTPGAIETRSCGACYHRPNPRRVGRSAERSCK